MLDQVLRQSQKVLEYQKNRIVKCSQIKLRSSQYQAQWYVYIPELRGVKISKRYPVEACVTKTNTVSYVLLS